MILLSRFSNKQNWKSSEVILRKQGTTSTARDFFLLVVLELASCSSWSRRLVALASASWALRAPTVLQAGDGVAWPLGRTGEGRTGTTAGTSSPSATGSSVALHLTFLAMPAWLVFYEFYGS